MEHQSATLKLFINAVNITPVSIEIIAAVVGSNGRHHPPTAKNIFMKWDCSVTATKNTLNNRTQEWIWSAVMPLTRRYHMDILSQELRQLRTRFYTDTLLPKAKQCLDTLVPRSSQMMKDLFESCLCSLRLNLTWHLENLQDKYASQMSYTFLERLRIWERIETSNVQSGN